jgi:hypothetical protein
VHAPPLVDAPLRAPCSSARGSARSARRAPAAARRRPALAALHAFGTPLTGEPAVSFCFCCARRWYMLKSPACAAEDAAHLVRAAHIADAAAGRCAPHPKSGAASRASCDGQHTHLQAVGVWLSSCGARLSTRRMRACRRSRPRGGRSVPGPPACLPPTINTVLSPCSRALQFGQGGARAEVLAAAQANGAAAGGTGAQQAVTCACRTLAR